MKEFTSLVEDELRRRLTIRGRRSTSFGDWEVALEAGSKEAVWDAEELEVVLRDLVNGGVVEARECVGVVKRETSVSRSDANRLVGRLAGASKLAVEQCRSWREKGRTRIRVTHAPQPAPIPSAETPPESTTGTTSEETP